MGALVVDAVVVVGVVIVGVVVVGGVVVGGVVVGGVVVGGVVVGGVVVGGVIVGAVVGAVSTAVPGWVGGDVGDLGCTASMGVPLTAGNGAIVGVAEDANVKPLAGAVALGTPSARSPCPDRREVARDGDRAPTRVLKGKLVAGFSVVAPVPVGCPTASFVFAVESGIVADFGSVPRRSEG